MNIFKKELTFNAKISTRTNFFSLTFLASFKNSYHLRNQHLERNEMRHTYYYNNHHFCTI